MLFTDICDAYPGEIADVELKTTCNVMHIAALIAAIRLRLAVHLLWRVIIIVTDIVWCQYVIVEVVSLVIVAFLRYRIKSFISFITLQVKVSELTELKQFRALSSSHRLNFNANQPQKSRISAPNRSQKQNASRPNKNIIAERRKKSIIYIIVDILIDIVVEKIAIDVVSHLR